MKLNFFVPKEFDLTPHGGKDWWEAMDPNVLLILDDARRLLGAPISISPHRAALGRHLKLSYSDHNVDRWKGVRCADVFPSIAQNTDAALEFVSICKEAGATALGLYPHWIDRRGNQRVGFHIGYRPERTDNPALWGMIRYKSRGTQHMVPLHHAAKLVGVPPRPPGE